MNEEVRRHLEPGEVEMAAPPLEQAMRGLAQGCAEGKHPGAQLYVSRFGRAVLEYACGEAAPGIPLSCDSLMAWFSASKPVTAMAIALLLDRGLLGLDDPVRRYLPAFANGKERCTIRNVLTHQGGFSQAVPSPAGRTTEEIIAEICVHPAEYPPGSKAGYHPTGGWYVLAEIVRIVDGRPIDRFADEEFFRPLGMESTRMGIPPAQQPELRPRLARVALGKTEREPYATPAMIETFNSAKELERVNPSGGIRGPARELGRLYELLLAGGEWEGRRLLDPRTVALFTACHRWDMPDLTLMQAPLAWGLGFGLYGNADIHRDASRRVFSHSGMVSSIGLGDPGRGLACVVITSGLLDPMGNARRLREATGAVLKACG